MSDETPNSYVNMYRNKTTGEEYAGHLHFSDRDYAVRIGNTYYTDAGGIEYVGTIPSDEQPDIWPND